MLHCDAQIWNERQGRFQESQLRDRIDVLNGINGLYNVELRSDYARPSRRPALNSEQ